MIVYDLKCGAGHVFEGWFNDAADFDTQKERELVACPLCERSDVGRVPSALAIGAGGRGDHGDRAEPSGKDGSEGAATDGEPGAAAVKAALAALAKAQKEAVDKSDYVGGRFAEEARSMHYGEQDHRPIYGETDRDEARALHEEGVPAMPLLFPVRTRSDA